MSYEPKVQVVRGIGYEWGRQVWQESGPEAVLEEAPFAYLVTGVPMPGERVVAIGGGAFTVEGLANPTVVLDDGGVEYARVLRPYDPDEALVERVTDAILAEVAKQGVTPNRETWERYARAAIAAIREADHGE